VEKSKVVSLLKLGAKTGITLLALWYVFSRVDLQSVLQVMGRADLRWLLPALLLFILSKIVAALRLNICFRATGLSLSEGYNLKLYLLGMFYNLFLPGGIGGDGYKIWLLNKKEEVSAGNIFRAVLADRLSGITALFMLAVVFYYLLPAGFPGRAWIWLAAPAAPAVLWVACRRFAPLLTKAFLPAGVLSLGVQILQVLSAWTLLQALHVTGEENAYLFLFLISSIVAILPVTVGGIGAREFTFLTGASWMHIDAGQAVAMSLLFYLITLFTSFWGILFSIKPGWLEKSRKEP
jgi:uncharacterized membrane protein YbhN (UPF0104 family)